MRSAELTGSERRAAARRAVRSVRARRRTRGGSARRGFTIIELIVAIVILVVGVLGLASTAAMVSRMVGGAAHQTIAANIAASRFEQLRSIPCTEMKPGEETTRNIKERWNPTEDPENSSLYSVTDTITYTAAGGQSRTLAFRTYIPCR